MKIRYEVEVSDDFEKGCCLNCPFYEYITDEGSYCLLGMEYSQCNIEIIEEENKLK